MGIPLSPVHLSLTFTFSGLDSLSPFTPFPVSTQLTVVKDFKQAEIDVIKFELHMSSPVFVGSGERKKEKASRVPFYLTTPPTPSYPSFQLLIASTIPKLFLWNRFLKIAPDPFQASSRN